MNLYCILWYIRAISLGFEFILHILVHQGDLFRNQGDFFRTCIYIACFGAISLGYEFIWHDFVRQGDLLIYEYDFSERYGFNFFNIENILFLI